MALGLLLGAASSEAQEDQFHFSCNCTMEVGASAFVQDGVAFIDAAVAEREADVDWAFWERRVLAARLYLDEYGLTSPGGESSECDCLDIADDMAHGERDADAAGHGDGSGGDILVFDIVDSVADDSRAKEKAFGWVIVLTAPLDNSPADSVAVLFPAGDVWDGEVLVTFPGDSLQPSGIAMSGYIKIKKLNSGG